MKYKKEVLEMSENINSGDQVDQFHSRLHGIHENVDYPLIRGIRMYHNRNRLRFEAHWHTACEILYPVENTYTVSIQSETRILNPSDILIVAPGTIHSYEPPADGERIFILFDSGILAPVTGIRSLLYSLQPYLLISADSNPLLHETIRNGIEEIIREYDKNGPYAEAAIWSQILHILTILGRTNIYRASHTRRFLQDAKQEHVARLMEVCNYITDHIDENIDMDQLASIAGFSKFHFSRLFKEFTGSSVHDYLTEQRLTAAEQYLSDPAVNIMDVAMKAGFGSLSTFTRVFKSKWDMTPTAYQAMIKKDSTHT
jgi:AraC-like DNA-binding protein